MVETTFIFVDECDGTTADQKVLYMSISDRLQYMALSRMNVVIVTEASRSRTTGGICVGGVTSKTRGAILHLPPPGRNHLSFGKACDDEATNNSKCVETPKSLAEMLICVDSGKGLQTAGFRR